MQNEARRDETDETNRNEAQRNNSKPDFQSEVPGRMPERDVPDQIVLDLIGEKAAMFSSNVFFLAPPV